MRSTRALCSRLALRESVCVAPTRARRPCVHYLRSAMASGEPIAAQKAAEGSPSPAPSYAQTTARTEDLLEKLLRKVDALDSQVRKQGQEHHFQIRKMEGSISEKINAAINGGGNGGCGGAAGRGSSNQSPSISFRPVLRSRATTGCFGSSSYIDALISSPTAVMATSRNSRCSRSDNGSERADEDAPLHRSPIPPPAKIEEQNGPQRSPPTQPRPVERRGSSGTGVKKANLMAELHQREPRRGSLTTREPHPSGGEMMRPTDLRGSMMGRRGSQPHGGAALADATALAVAADGSGGDSQGSARSISSSASAPGQDEEDALTREERLRLMVTEDPNVEELLMRIRRAEMVAINGREQEESWQSSHPISSRLVLSPSSGLKAWWDVAMLMLVLLSAVMMPIDLAFDLGSGGPIVILFLLLDASFVSDFVLTFRIAFVADSSHLLIRQPSVIFRRWLTSWFVLDFIAAIPLASIDLIVSTLGARDDSTTALTALKLLRIIRLLKLPRLLGTNPLWRRLRSRLSNSYIQLTFALSFLLYSCHFCGCIYVVIAKHELAQLLVDHVAASFGADNTTEGFATYVLNTGMQGSWLPPQKCFTVEVTPGPELSSPPTFAVAGTGVPLYLYSLAYSLTALSGTGVPYPYTTLEMGFTAVVVLAGFLVTAYVIGTFTAALAQMSAASNLEYQKRDYVDQYLQRKQIPKALRRQVTQFYEFAGFDDSHAMLAELPISLRLQLDLVLNRDLFLKVPFFKNCETSFLIVMVPRIHRECSWWGKTVVHENLFATGLHMLARGFCKSSRDGRLDTLLCTNDFFGEESLLESDTASPKTIVTVTQCQFMVRDGQY